MLAAESAGALVYLTELDGRDTLVEELQESQQGALWNEGQMKSRGGRPSWALAALFTGAALLVISSRGASSGKMMSQAAMAHATATAAGSGPGLPDEFLGFQALADFFASERADVWLCSLVGSVAVGLTGIFPLLVIPIEAGAALETAAGCRKLKQLLSFAIGGLLGDVFLHLLPEAWAHSHSCSPDESQLHYRTQGLWVIMGMMSFLLLEKMFPDEHSQEDSIGNSQHVPTSHSSDSSSEVLSHINGHHFDTWSSSSKTKSSLQQVPKKIKTCGYLNLLANCIDNFTHGLAVAGSFLVSRKVGCLTTFAILLHEIPHEVGDFAILLRAGFDRWSAARMQLSTALGGVLGACFALCAQSPRGTGEPPSMQLSTALGGVLGACFALCAQSPRGTENATAWILPFSSGGFLYIALVNVVPDLLEETSLGHSLLQILLLCCGIAVMAVLSAVVD
ncbi:zinc transporter ZIP13-like isoform X1 [Salvelinus alpinus]|uniref:zinc transporter ZIP13-like isoform X1 n=1 Tax=Salvelinus alpinus TaxID=8036 RepID=UPI0039FD982C